jgi:hypothetical protein
MNDRDASANDPSTRGDDDVESVDFTDLDFDFEGYFEKHCAGWLTRNAEGLLIFPDGQQREEFNWRAIGNLTDDERQEFNARVIGMFCRDVFRKRNPSFAEYYLVEKMCRVLDGVKWNQVLDTPFEPREELLWTQLGKRAVEIYCFVSNARDERPETTLTDLLYEAASSHHVSFETARADYYAMRGAIGKPFPKRFLK